jgi:hypothetical protein
MGSDQFVPQLLNLDRGVAIASRPQGRSNLTAGYNAQAGIRCLGAFHHSACCTEKPL